MSDKALIETAIAIVDGWIQALIGAKARREIELRIIAEDLLEKEKDMTDKLLEAREEPIADWNTRAQASAEDARDAERWRYINAENNIWRREDGENPCSLLCVVLPYGADLSCRATREAAIDAAMRESARND